MNGADRQRPESADERALVDIRMSDLLEVMEQVDWRDVPGFSTGNEIRRQTTNTRLI